MKKNGLLPEDANYYFSCHTWLWNVTVPAEDPNMDLHNNIPAWSNHQTRLPQPFVVSKNSVHKNHEQTQWQKESLLEYNMHREKFQLASKTNQVPAAQRLDAFVGRYWTPYPQNTFLIPLQGKRWNTFSKSPKHMSMWKNLRPCFYWAILSVKVQSDLEWSWQFRWAFPLKVGLSGCMWGESNNSSESLILYRSAVSVLALAWLL